MLRMAPMGMEEPVSSAIEVANLGIKFTAKRSRRRLINYVPNPAALLRRRNGHGMGQGNEGDEGNDKKSSYSSDFWALRHVTFTVDQGERVGIIGTNGSGKSTLLRSIAGIYSPDTGSVTLHTPVSTIMSLSLGFQHDLNGIDIIRLSGAIMGMSSRAIEQAVPKIVDFADLDPPSKINDPIRTYSSGMQARLAFSLAIHTHAPTVLIDEILGAGDAAFHAKCQAAVRTMLTDKTLLLVSHSPDQILSFCTRALWLHRGILHMDGPAKDVTESYSAYVASITPQTKEELHA
jgi:ABC-type polysaccharide/polyol phosphate transport system ATPase subunit